MKIRTTIFAIVIIAIALANCAKKQVYTHETDDYVIIPSIKSKALSLKTIGIGDTVMAFISGTIFGKDSADKKVTIDTLIFAVIGFISHERHDTVGTNSDIHGTFKKHLKAGTYDIIVRYVGYTGLMIKNVPFGQGELKEFDVLLGQQGHTIIESVVDVKKPNCSSYFDKSLNKQVYTFADKMPEYGKGLADILSFFSKNFVYPTEQQDNFQGSISISFIVDIDGQLKNVDVENKFYGDHYSPVDLEAISVFKRMPPWTPGQCNGLTVPVKIKIPIKF